MKLFSKLSEPHLLRGLYYIALVAPLAVINVPLLVLLNSTTYSGYLIFFLAFFSFSKILRDKKPDLSSFTGFQKIRHYSALIILGLCLVFGLALLNPDSIEQQTSKLPLYFCLLTCTLHALLYSKRTQNSVYLWSGLHVAMLTALIFSGFVSLKFPALYGAAFFSLALATTFSAPHLLIRLQSFSQEALSDISEVRTRKQRRKYRAVSDYLASSTGWRWYMIALLLLGPTIIATISMTELFPSEYGIIVFILTIARQLVQPLPVKGPVKTVPEGLLKEWLWFCYLFLLGLLLVRLMLLRIPLG